MKRCLKAFLYVLTLMLTLVFAVTAFAAGAKVSAKAFNTAQGIRLEWSECEGAYYYEVYRQVGRKGEKLVVSKVQNTFYEDTDVSHGTAYSYTVVPVYSDYTTGAESDEQLVYCLPAVYISEAGSQRNGIHLKWDAVKSCKGYNVYRKASQDMQWENIAKLDAADREFVDGEISPGELYTYCVKAFAGEYESASGNEKQLSYISFPEMTAITNTDDGVLLSWEDTGDGAYYIVYRKADDEEEYKPIALLDTGYIEYEDKNPEAGKLCSYYVCGADKDGNKGSYDRAVSIRYVKKSVITAAVNTKEGVKLTWSKSKGCHGYAIFKKALGEEEWKLRGVVYGENNLSAVDSKVSDRRIYTYTVRAIKDKTFASYDEVGTTIRYYAAPEGLRCVSADRDANVLEWKENSAVKHYAVYRKTADTDWEFMCFTSKNKFTDKAVKAKVKYAYAIEAYEGSVLKSGKAEIVAK